jgi:hypothetical protein
MRGSVAVALLSVALAVAATFAIWQAAGAPWQSENPAQSTPASQPVRETQLEKCQRAQIAFDAAARWTGLGESSLSDFQGEVVGKFLFNVFSACAPEVKLGE